MEVEGNIAELMKPLLAGQMLETKWPGDQEATYMAMVSVPQSHIFNGLGWHVVVRESASAVNAGIVRMNWRVVGVSVLTGLVFSILGLFAVRQITRPLQILANDITKFGETETPPQSGSSTQIAEVKNIHSAFRDMAANVLIHQKLLSETQVEIVKALGRAGEFRDNETGNHVFRMSICSARLAELAGMKPQDVEVLRLASQMHDIGKIGIPDHVLLKPGKFDDAERAIMERHCEIGAGILTGLDSPLIVMARSIALSHHEKWDGSGYPHRLSGSAIPLEGRVAAICDVFDALLSSRPYKQGWPLEKVLAFMREQSGRHFDPALIALFLQHIDDFTQIRSQFVDEPVLEEMTVSSN